MFLLQRDSFPPKLILGATSGALLVLSLPKPDLHHLAWIALVPLLVALSSERNRWKAAGIGYAAGLVYFAGTCYWMPLTITRFGGVSPSVSWSIFALFFVVFALYFALFAILLHRLVRSFSNMGLFFAAPLWVSTELLRAYFPFGGFPWMLLGYALAPYEGILQIVAWTGIYGLSFVLVAVSSAVAYWVVTRKSNWLIAAAILIVLCVAVPLVGTEPSGDPVSVRIVQANVPIDASWQKTTMNELVEELTDLSTDSETDPELVVWPETPAPFYYDYSPTFRARMESIARETGAYFILSNMPFRGESAWNSAVLLSPSGQVISRYDKIHLVPFGEYVPMRNLLFFAGKIVQNVGDFTPGAEYTVSSLGNHHAATAICYESIFPGLIRQFTTRGAEMILNITNDGWYGDSSAPYQLLRMSAVRAAENRRYLIRSANTGISAIIDPYGQILEWIRIGQRRVLNATVHFRSDLTFYAKYGDLFAYFVVLATAVAFGFAHRGRKK